jgi:hypothetical protein
MKSHKESSKREEGPNNKRNRMMKSDISKRKARINRTQLPRWKPDLGLRPSDGYRMQRHHDQGMKPKPSKLMPMPLQLPPLLLRRPRLPDGTIQSVPLGTTKSFAAGMYVMQNANVTFQIDGDELGVFRIVAVETDNVVIFDDPDAPGHRVLVLEVAESVMGAGPIQISAGQAVIVSVEFSCPVDPSQGMFKATLNGSGAIQLQIVATADLGALVGNTVVSPENLAPGEAGNFAFELFSSMGHPVTVSLEYDEAFDANFSAPTSAPITVPAAGGTATVNVPVTCAQGTPEGIHYFGFKFVALDGTQLGWMTTDVNVISGTVITTIDSQSTSLLMLAGGLTPINVTLQSIRGGATDITYEISGLGNSAGPFGLSGPPLHVDAGETTRGTLWLRASSDAPANATLQIAQNSFNPDPQGGPISTNIFVTVEQPPSSEEFVVLRIYWGPKWTDGNPFPWQKMEQAIFTAIRSTYFQGLNEYGVSKVNDVAVSNDPGLPGTTLLAFAIEPTFPSSNDFDDSDLIGLITRLIDSGRLPRPDGINGTPFYYVMPQQGSFYRPNRDGILGAHSTFGFDGVDHLYGWGYQGMTVDGTTPTFGHEVAEALSAKVAGTEVTDPCQKLQGNSAGVVLQPYLSKLRNLCVLPDMTSDPSVAATPPVPGVTG